MTHVFNLYYSSEWEKVKKVAKRVVKGLKRPKKHPPMAMDGIRSGLFQHVSWAITFGIICISKSTVTDCLTENKPIERNVSINLKQLFKN